MEKRGLKFFKNLICFFVKLFLDFFWNTGKFKVDVVREVSDEGLKQLKFQHEQEIIQIRKRADTNVKRLKVSELLY